jgi:hypothetical protein
MSEVLKRYRRLTRKPQRVRAKRETREVIISFRLRKSEAKMLVREMKTRPMADIKSLKQFARKLTLDHALRRTVYIDSTDMKIGPDSRQELNFSYNCRIPNPRFRKALIGYLNTPENWRKLRLFMLLAGWPEESVTRYSEADNEQERLLIAQEVLQDMVD